MLGFQISAGITIPFCLSSSFSTEHKGGEIRNMEVFQLLKQKQLINVQTLGKLLQ